LMTTTPADALGRGSRLGGRGGDLPGQHGHAVLSNMSRAWYSYRSTSVHVLTLGRSGCPSRASSPRSRRRNPSAGGGRSSTARRCRYRPPRGRLLGSMDTTAREVPPQPRTVPPGRAHPGSPRPGSRGPGHRRVGAGRRAAGGRARLGRRPEHRVPGGCTVGGDGVGGGGTGGDGVGGDGVGGDGVGAAVSRTAAPGHDACHCISLGSSRLGRAWLPRRGCSSPAGTCCTSAR
jgi:hypothetical protein